jgi:hypothetical protein
MSAIEHLVELRRENDALRAHVRELQELLACVAKERDDERAAHNALVADLARKEWR